MNDTPFHAGEQAVQALAGESQIAQRVGQMLQPEIGVQAIPFLQQQPMVVIASPDTNGHIWASLLVGDVGFVEVFSTQSLVLHEDQLQSADTDILYENLKGNPRVGLLFHEMEHRRRYRVNGQAVRKDGQIQINVEEAYVNCPKYIQKRTTTRREEIQAPVRVSRGQVLGALELDWIRQADTFFLATQSLAGKADASHRGGKAGFVEILDNGQLRIPDYPGNSLFNSLGNIHENPKAGLLFVDFEQGNVLQLTGKATLSFGQNAADDLAKTGDTGRFWLFETTEWIRTDHHHQKQWDWVDYSPFNP
ncbi:MAG: pyridoxamine 5'-phosphate oxidase family protein [Bacteroidota bacterium]